MTILLILVWLSEVSAGIVITALFALAGIFFYAMFQELTPEELKNKFKWHMISAVALLLIAILAPREKTMYLYAASVGGEAIVNLPEFEKARKLLNKELDSLIKED